MMVILLLAGCGRPIQSAPGQWYKNATGQALPAGVEELNAEVIVMLGAGDTYYLKLRVPKGAEGFAQAGFQATDWSEAGKGLKPPDDWMRDLPFWDVEAAKTATHFVARRPGWLCYLATGADGVCWFVGMQTGR